MRQILFLTQVLPYPLDAGPKTRAYYVLKYLARRHHVTLLSFVRDSDPAGALEHLRGLCQEVLTVPMPRSRLRDAWALLRSFARGLPFLITRDRVTEMERQVLCQLEGHSFDYVHADQLWMAPYALMARQATAPRPRLVLDQHNAVHLIPQRMAEGMRNPLVRWLLRREARLMARYEAQVCSAFDHVVWVTAEDRAAVQHSRPLARGQRVIPICSDAQAPANERDLAAAKGVLFVGGMHWPPNAAGVRWFVQQVWPQVLAAVPGTVFSMVGKTPPPDLLHADGVKAPGYMDDIEGCWNTHRVFVVPLQAGGGMRVKILDAWAHGVPVVSTTIGAEGLSYCDGQDILIADQPEAFARCVIDLLGDVSAAQRIAQGGLARVRQHYHWETIYPAWDAIYHD